MVLAKKATKIPSTYPPNISIGKWTPAEIRATPINNAQTKRTYPIFLLCPPVALAEEDEKNIDIARAEKNVACPDGKE